MSTRAVPDCTSNDGVLLVIAGGLQTVMTAAALSAVRPQVPVRRTQYVVELDGVTVSVADVAPATGFVVVPGVPVYHWNVWPPMGVVPTLSVAEAPDAIVDPTGCAVTAGLHTRTVKTSV